jgi:hypothetical protein
MPFDQNFLPILGFVASRPLPSMLSAHADELSIQGAALALPSALVA